ncbi:pyridoxamine 5'-phosphate oxidase family protein [bacterium SCSIO 12643]|nr:pyridoxamine 5'-phosphate oxidase family protein [bacterium SCSIO 12643]
MGKRIPELTNELIRFIEQQKMFFVGTARSEGTVNISPKAMDSLRVIDKNTIVWLNLTGSGNETATHLLENDRMTIMFMAFDGKPLILRLYGNAKAYHPRDEKYQECILMFPDDPGARQIIVMQVNLVQSSCGYAVPFMEFKEDRNILKSWSEKQGRDRIKEYWKEKNSISLDGFHTGIIE